MTDRHPFPTRRSGKLAAALALLLGASAPALAVTVSFREGASGYLGCQDTFLQQNPPNAGTNNGAQASCGWDGDDPAGTGLDQYTLLRFDAIVGNGAGQIPPGATITSATLTYTVFDVGDPATVHPVLTSWTEASTYTAYCGGGGCLEGTQFGPAAASATATANGAVSVSVTSTVQAWASGSTNLGWFFFPTAGGGVDIRSSEHATVTERPLLTVVYNEGGPTSNLVRQPYLQLPTPTSMTIVWRTDVATDSRVRYGTVAGTLNQTATVPAAVVNHVVTVSGLNPATRYYYDVGSTAGMQGGGTVEHYFDTAPVVGSMAPFNVWVLGDSGTGDSNQSSVRDAMLAFTAGNPPEFMVHLGDIAYTSGTEAEFDTKHFTPYQNITRHMPHWPTLGNHEGQSTSSGAPGPSSGPYYDAFVLPTSGEAGGTSSGTEAYYSFDYGNVHFVVLNSYQVSRSATGAMATWLQSDLAATNQQWIVAYWHHPPYTRGTHNSDAEIELIQMRENLLPILEAGGVDLVLAGHSHTYERSYLIDGTYSTPTPSFAALEAAGNVLDDGDGQPAGTAPTTSRPGTRHTTAPCMSWPATGVQPPGARSTIPSCTTRRRTMARDSWR